MEKYIIVYFVAENGSMDQKLVNHFLNLFEKKGFTIRDIGAGSAYNMPVYLLGEIEEHIDEAVVVSFYWNVDTLVPMVFFSNDEINAVKERLETADESDDSFEILKEVHAKIRRL